jgi:hypothetical protein
VLEVADVDRFQDLILTLSVPLRALAFGNEAHARFASCLCRRRRRSALALIPVGFALLAASAIVAPCVAAIRGLWNPWLRPRSTAALERHERQQKRRRHQCIIHLYLYSRSLFQIEHSALQKKNNGTSPKARPGRHLCCST